MKKYIKPTMAIANIGNEIILAGSTPILSIDVDENKTITDDSNVGARQRGLFDWNEDDEE